MNVKQCLSFNSDNTKCFFVKCFALRKQVGSLTVQFDRRVKSGHFQLLVVDPYFPNLNYLSTLQSCGPILNRHLLEDSFTKRPFWGSPRQCHMQNLMMARYNLLNIRSSCSNLCKGNLLKPYMAYPHCRTSSPATNMLLKFDVSFVTWLNNLKSNCDLTNSLKIQEMNLSESLPILLRLLGGRPCHLQSPDFRSCLPFASPAHVIMLQCFESFGHSFRVYTKSHVVRIYYVELYIHILYIYSTLATYHTCSIYIYIYVYIYTYIYLHIIYILYISVISKSREGSND